MTSISHSDIKKTIRWFGNHTVALRMLKPDPKNPKITSTRSGVFDLSHMDSIIREVEKSTRAGYQAYLCLNTADAYVNNCCYPGGKSVSDSQITRIINILIDSDPERSWTDPETGKETKKISATDTEKAGAWLELTAIHAHLDAAGFKNPLIGDSGNGFHAVYPVDMPNDPESVAMVKGFLRKLKEKFHTVDTSVFNAGQISKLYGSVAQKGPNLPDRPHRLSRIVELPEGRTDNTDALRAYMGAPVGNVVPVLAEVNVADVVATPPDDKQIDAAEQARQVGWLKAWMRAHGINVLRERQADGVQWLYVVCPWNPDHTGDVAVGVLPSGAIVFSCFHDSCKSAGHNWQEYRAFYEPKEPEIRLTDLGNTRRLLKLMQGKFFYGVNRKSWLHYDSGAWRQDDLAAAERAVDDCIKSIYTESNALAAAAGRNTDDEKKAALTKQAKELFTHAIKTEALRSRWAMLKGAEPYLTKRETDFDTDPWLFNCANGTLDLRTGKLRSHDPNDLLMKQSPVSYNPDATCPRFDRFLTEVFPDDTALQKFVQVFAGYSMTGITREHCAAILFGARGRNGKSTFLETLREVFGSYAETCPSEMLLVQKNESGNTNDLAKLAGARLVIASETAEGRRMNTAKMKQITGGDTITARFLHKEFFDFRPMFKIWLSTNHKPRAPEEDTAFWSRVRPIEFPRRFVGDDPAQPDYQDKTLPATLAKELPGILRWAVAGCLAWQEGGLHSPAAVIRATKEYQDENDVVGQWLEDRCEIGPEHEMHSGELFRNFQDWVIQNSVKGNYSQRWLSDSLISRGQFGPKKDRYGGRMIKGLRVNTSPFDCMSEEDKINPLS